MTKIKKKQKRNTNHQFSYLPYPTFLIQRFENGKSFFKCFKCYSTFPTKYRLSRHLRLSKCTKNYNSLVLNNKKAIELDTERELNFNFSTLLRAENEFRKKKEIISFYSSEIEENKFKASKKISSKKNKNFSLNKFTFKNLKLIDNNIIGEGHFAKVFCIKYNKPKSFYAIKEIKNNTITINREVKILQQLQGINGIPKIFDFIDGKEIKIIIQSLCGPSIDKIHWFCGNKFNELTCLEIGIQLISILKDIHNIGILHRDLKPSNICYGIFNEEDNTFLKSLNIIDFGLSQNINCIKADKKSSMGKIRKFTGNLLFASTGALEGFGHYPKDDLEAIFYILAYLRNGTLPWIKNQIENKIQYLYEILNIRKKIEPRDILKGFGEEIIFLYKTIKMLSPNDKPDYDIYINILKMAKGKINIKNNINSSLKFEWEFKIEKILKKLQLLKVKKEDLLGVSLLKKGYLFTLEEFMKNFI